MIEIKAQQNNKNRTNQYESFQNLPPQVKIYNRYFYLRRNKQQQLQRQYQKKINQMACLSKLVPNSYLILAQKLEADIMQIIRQISQEQGVIDFEGFRQIINRLNHFDQITTQKEKLELQILHTQLWLLLIRYDSDLPEQVENKYVISLLHILMCPYNLKAAQIKKLLDNSFPDLDAKRQQYIQCFPQYEKQILDLGGIIKLWHKLKNTNPHPYGNRKKQVTQKLKFEFKPKINSKSRIYADKSLSKYLSTHRIQNNKDIRNEQDNQLSHYISKHEKLDIPYYDILYRRKLEKDLLSKNGQVDVNVTKPKLMSLDEVKKIVDNLYIKKEKREDLDLDKRDQQEQIKLCTFKPEIIQYKKSKPNTTIKNYEKQIERFQKARMEKLKLKQAFQNLGRTKQSAINQKAPSFIQRQTPRLILQINISQNRVQQIKLKGDEDPKIVAKKFVIKHNLQKEMQSVLESIIQQQLHTL